MAQIEVINKRITELAKLLPNFEASCSTSILEGAALISKTFNSGLKVLICGNGGSAAIASHFTIDLIKNTNISSTLIDNSLSYSSLESYTDSGIASDYNIEFRNSNTMSDNSLKYKKVVIINGLFYFVSNK